MTNEPHITKTRIKSNLEEACDNLHMIMDTELTQYSLDIHGEGSGEYELAKQALILIRNHMNLEV